MKIVVYETKGSHELDVSGTGTLLETLEENGIHVESACGASCHCHKCCVLVHDADGVSNRRACQTPVSDGMEVAIDRRYGKLTNLVNMQSKWGADGEGWGYGYAIDVGTDTVVCRLYDLETGKIMGTTMRTNPQIVFGTDIANRLRACSQGYLKDMSRILGETLVDMAGELADVAGIDLTQVSYTVLAGNTVMEHIAAEIDPSPIRRPPYEPPTCFGDEIDYIAFQKGDIAAGTTLFSSCISAYVGGDFTCSMLALDALHTQEPMLFIDLGASGEIAIVDESGIDVCAISVASVFEGGGIKYGMAARPGAISRLVYSGGCFVTTVIAGVEPMGVCCTGLIDCAAIMLDYGVIDPLGRILTDDEIDTARSQGMEYFLCDRDGERCIQLAPDVYVTQSDIYTLQACKAAVRAAIDVLLERRSIAMGDIKDLVIAGSFGQFLSLSSASRIGLVPYELLYCAHTVGNTTLEGASALLISDEAADELDSIVSACRCIDLARTPYFERCYLESFQFGLCAC